MSSNSMVFSCLNLEPTPYVGIEAVQSTNANVYPDN